MATEPNLAGQTSLLAVLSPHPQGLNIAEIQTSLEAAGSAAPSSRTLRRRLQQLADRGVILITGRTKNRRYRVATRPDSNSPGPGQTAEDSIALTPQGQAVMDELRRRNATRNPVGYNEQFLDEYIPGKSWYLNEATRSRLRALGTTADQSRPAGTFARDVYKRLLIDLAWSSSRLEGNTYSRLDTLNLLEHGIRAEGKDATEAVMLLNHKKAIAMLVDEAEHIGFNRYTLLNLHAALSEGLMPDARDEGRLRDKVVTIGSSTYVPIAIPQKIEEHFDVILAKVADIPDPFEQSFFMMVHLPYLQPFADVNKRTSRLAANISLVKHNLCPLSFVGVPEQAYIDGTLAIYEVNRIELLRDVYVWAYARSCEQYRVVHQSAAQPDPIRVRYRTQINDLVRTLVIEGQMPRRSIIEDRILRLDIPPAESGPVANIVLELLLNLHEGSTYRYGIRPGEFLSWKQKLDQPR